MPHSTTLKVGDHVRWTTSQGETHGKVVERKTGDFHIDQQQFRASADEPMFVVVSDPTGARAAHKATALRRR
jgi:plastocyanin